MAEEVGFEPTELSLYGFQDRRLRPLGHSSKLKVIGDRNMVCYMVSGPETDDRLPITIAHTGFLDVILYQNLQFCLKRYKNEFTIIL